MAEVIATSQWIQFFTNAGLPQGVSAQYAIIFSDNRIQIDMLMDLSKEYLFDMGIRTMGDVIAILRYAKEFHSQLAKDKVMKIAVNSPKKAVERMLGHYSRPSPVAAPALPPVQKQQIIARIPTKKSNIVSLKRAAVSSPYTKKVRKVPPEEEGAYRIKMPSGTTERTRKILQQQKRLQLASTRSVFERLGGESAVSSSTDTKKASSVFVRLGSSSKGGGLHDELPTSTVAGEREEMRKVVQALPYKGVLKMTVGSNKKISASIIKSGQTLRRTVLNPGRGSKLSNAITKTFSVNRINTILASTNMSTRSQDLNRNSGVLGDRITLSRTSNVKSRLGNKAVVGKFDPSRLGKARVNISVHKASTVFDRLGN